MTRKNYSTNLHEKNAQSDEMRLVNVGAARAEYDPELPNAHAVMAAICCVSVRYAANPTLALALLAADLSFKLTAEAYAESDLICEIAQHLVRQWDAIVSRHQEIAMMQMTSSGTKH